MVDLYLVRRCDYPGEIRQSSTTRVGLCHEHLENIRELLDQALEIVALTRLEIHGPDEERAKLRGPLAKLDPRFYTLEYGFRH